MQIICLAAGDGKRFTESKYEYGRPKPFIEVNGKTIIEHTLDSIPDIKLKNLPITFALRSEHLMDEYGCLVKNYNENVKISAFPQLTRGNLETAYITVLQTRPNLDEPLLILDSDNKYLGDYLLPFIKGVSASCKWDFALICYFSPLDNSTKWGFAILDEYNSVIKILEKEPTALLRGGQPMVGTFYFSTTRLFMEYAEKAFEQMVKGEYYMTQAINKLLEDKITVYGYKVTNVVPLGTPEDVEIFRSKGLQ